MNQKQIRAAVEAMLFASGDPIGADKLAQAVQLPQLSVEAALEALREHYTREDSGLCLLHLNTRWQLATKTEWADCIRHENIWNCHSSVFIRPCLPDKYE